MNVIVDIGGSSKCFKTISINVDEVWRKGNGFSSEIGKEAKCGNGSM